MPALCRLAGAPENLLPLCIPYGRILSACIPIGALFLAFQSLLISAGQQNLGLYASIINAAVNIGLDILFLRVFHWNRIEAVGIAAVSGWLTGLILPLIYFSRKSSRIHFARFRFSGTVLRKTLLNGLSEMVDNGSVAIVSIFYNRELIRFFGEDGVDAYGVISYVSSVFLSIAMGICLSITPAVAFHCGENDREEVLKLRKMGTILNIILGIFIGGLSVLLARPLAAVFVAYDEELMRLTVHALSIYAISFIFNGAADYGAAFYTGLNDGVTSAIIALSIAMVFPCLLIEACALFSRAELLWYVMPVAEFLGLLVVFYCYRHRNSHLPKELRK